MPKTPAFFQITKFEQNNNIEHLSQSILNPNASIAAKYLYNQLGSKLFESITHLPEYYPTRTEFEIFNLFQQEINETIPNDAVVIDLGAGNCQKGAHLVGHISASHYVAVDISTDFLQQSIVFLQTQYPELEITAVGLDFSKELYLPEQLGISETKPKVFFYPGSSIGNFSPSEATAFLKQIKQLCNTNPESGLLIGVDLVKNIKTLNSAYDDSLGVTAAFNRNILMHVNSLLETDFMIAQWQHLATFNQEHSRIEMHLEANQQLTVNWQNKQRQFKQGETIHTENSYKWTIDSFKTTLNEAGFENITVFTDPNQWYALFWAN